MNSFKASKKSTAHGYSPETAIARVNPGARQTKFPENFLVVGAGDENGTWILVVVVR